MAKWHFRNILSFLFFITILSFIAIFVKAESNGYDTNPALDRNSLQNSAATNNPNIAIDTLNSDKIPALRSEFIFVQEGIASWYGKKFQKRKTSNGEKYDMYGFTAAHPDIPFGTILRVTNEETGRAILVRINDRGPLVGKRIVDLSYSAASEIDILGLSKVKIECLTNTKELKDKGIIQNDYYVGFSLDKPLIYLPLSSVKVIDSTQDFNNAVKIYKELSFNNPGQLLYLMSSPVDLAQENGNNSFYYVSVYRPTKEIVKDTKELTYNK